MRRSALEQRIAEVQPYQYTNIVKLQNERLPKKGSLKFTKVDSIIYKNTVIETTEDSVVFKIEGLPFTEEFEMNSYFDKSISDCIQERLLFAFTIIAYGPTSKDISDYLYLRNGSTLDFWDNTRIVYTIHETYMVLQTNQTMTLDKMISVFSSNEIALMIYPIEFSDLSTYEADGSILYNMNKYEVDTISAKLIEEGNEAYGIIEIGVPYSHYDSPRMFNLSRLVDNNINVIVIDRDRNKINVPISYMIRRSLNIFKVIIEVPEGETFESLGLDFINNSYFLECTVMQYKMPEEEYYTCYDKACHIIKDNTDIGTPEETLSYITDPNNSPISAAGIASLNTELNFWDSENPEDTFKLRLAQILNYDISIIDDILGDSPYQFESFKTTGIALKSSYDNATCRVSIPLRNLESTHNTIVLLFKNGTLYDKYDTIQYRFGSVTFEYDEAYESDVYEIVYIHGVQYYPDKVCSVGGTIDCTLNLDEYEFYMKTPDNQYFPDLNLSNTYQIKATDVTLTNVEGITFTINSSEFPAGTELICTMVNKYRYVSYTITEECINISLPDSFKYCQNKDQYMVFLNGKKINNDDFIIIKPTRTTPFYELALFSKIVFEKSDKIDIFYIPVISSVKGHFNKLNDNSLYIQYNYIQKGGLR